MTEKMVLDKINEYESVFHEELPKLTSNERNFAENYVWAINKCLAEHKTMEEMGFSIFDLSDECPPHRLDYAE